VREALRERLHLLEPVISLEGVGEFADGHLLSLAVKNTSCPCRSDASLSSRPLWGRRIGARPGQICAMPPSAKSSAPVT
jgi:hypothetical protein